MIRQAGVSDSTGDKVNVSLRDFSKNSGMASKVELMNVDILIFFGLQQITSKQQI